MRRSFDSNEEKYIDWYLQTLLNHGYVDSYNFEDFSFPLSKKITHNWIKPMKRVDDKEMETTILQPHSYTPDVVVKWDYSAKGLFYQNLEDNEKITAPFVAQRNESIWEIKGGFDFQNMTRLATLNIKWVMDKYGKYIQIVTPDKIFNKTFTPERYLLTDKSFKPRKLKYKNVKTIKQFKYEVS